MKALCFCSHQDDHYKIFCPDFCVQYYHDPVYCCPYHCPYHRGLRASECAALRECSSAWGQATGTAWRHLGHCLQRPMEWTGRLSCVPPTRVQVSWCSLVVMDLLGLDTIAGHPPYQICTWSVAHTNASCISPSELSGVNNKGFIGILGFIMLNTRS